MKRLLFPFLVLLAPAIICAQNSDSEIWFTNLEEAMQDPEKVFKLNLSNQQLSSIPKEIFQFKNLEDLELDSNNIGVIPEMLSSLRHLSYISFSHNRVESIPTEILNMPQLIGLDASHNRISRLPDDAFKKTGIIYLHLSWNLFTEIPSPVKRLKHELEILDISNNYITCLPNWFAKTGCIYELMLNNNMLSGIDVSLLKKLQQSECNWSLYLRGNPIELAVQDSLHSYLKSYFQYDLDEGKKYHDYVDINW